MLGKMDILSGAITLDKWQHDLSWRCTVLERALNALSMGVSITDETGKLLFQNSQAQEVERQGDTTEFVQTQRDTFDDGISVVVQESLSPATNQLLRRVFNSSKIPFVICRADGHTEFLSEELFRKTGKPEHELLGWKYESVIHPDDIADAINNWVAAVKAEKPYVSKEFRMITHSGDTRWLVYSTAPVYNDYGTLVKWIGVDLDVTDQVSMRAAAEAERAIFKTAVDQLPVGLIVAEFPDGKTRLVNQKAKRTWYHPTHESDSISDYGSWTAFHQDGQRYKTEDFPLARTLMYEVVVENELMQFLRPDQTVGTCSVTSTPVYGADGGRPIAALVVFEDVTERLKADEQKARLMAAEHAAKATADLLANVSHELRTPLNAVIGMAELLFATDKLDDEQREYVKLTREAGVLLLAVINDVLDHEKLRAGKLVLESAPFSMEEVVGSTVMLLSEMATKAGVSLLRTVDDGLRGRILLGDPQRLKQIIMNLLSNAIRFTPRGGRVHVNAIILSLAEKDVTVRVSVEDTGIGMSDETMNRIFAPFMQADSSTTRRFGGTGLGLAICKNLLKLMQGDIHAASTLGEGSRFWFDVTLPLQTVSPASGSVDTAPPAAARDEVRVVVPQASAAAVAEQASNVATARVLVAEDNDVNRLLIQRILRNGGYKCVTVVPDGKQAAERAAAEDFDVILMDCQMPVMDGYEATRRIRSCGHATRANTPIIALTASALAADVERSMQAGMNDHIAKPYNAAVLLAAMRKYHG